MKEDGFFCEYSLSMKIEHIGIAVKDLVQAEKIYSDILGVSAYKREIVESEGVETSFFNCGDSKIELLSSIKDDSAVAKFLMKRGPGVHHIAYLVDHLEQEVDRLKKLGYQLINDVPKLGADNKRIVFLHPKCTEGVLIELCEQIR